MKNLFFIVLVVLLSGCATRRYAIPRHARATTYTMETTGYCKCGKCCGWKRNWLFQPVYASGSSKGKRKEVGVTASGTKARPGTIAADTRYFPFGTVIYIPQYGYGRVEDIGGDIKGMHIDLYFHTHDEALRWGRRKTQVKVWKPAR